MNKKRGALLLLCAVLIFGYIKLFYKTWSVNVVAKGADCIIAIDVKRVTNTLIWNLVTTPSQWKTGNIFSKTAAHQISWKDMIEIPDYVLPFHVRHQPANQWFVVLKIKKETDFNEGLQYYHFQKLNSSEYISDDLGIRFFREDDKILVTKNTPATDSSLAMVANELFTRKAFIEKEKLEMVINAKSHLAVYFAANKFLQQDAVLQANFDKEKIALHADITPARQYSFTENNFPAFPASLLTVNLTQPGNEVFNLLDTSAKNNISTFLNLNVDSVFRQDNKWYSLDIAAIQPRTDSAVTYTYDDDFNKVEKVVPNNVWEPLYNFSIEGGSVKNIYGYFLRNNKLESNEAGLLFTPVPFVKSYCSLNNEKSLRISAKNYAVQNTSASINAVFFLNFLPGKMPVVLLNYLPGAVVNAVSNIESIWIKANKKNEQVEINCTIQKKKNDLPILQL
jgi:hypothetical protein